MRVLLLYITIMNFLTYIAFGVDKARAKKNKWRIPEARLISLSLLGGAFGGWRGMIDYHHKTTKPKFRILIPLFAVIQLLVILYLYLKWFFSDFNSLLPLLVTVFIHGALFILLFQFSSRRRR